MEIREIMSSTDEIEFILMNFSSSSSQKFLEVGGFLGFFNVSITATGGKLMVSCVEGIMVETGFIFEFIWTRVGVLCRAFSSKCL